MKIQQYWPYGALLLALTVVILPVWAGGNNDDDKGGPGVFNFVCGRGQPLSSVLNRVRPGDTVRVTGTCSENLVIPEEISRITFDGQGSAHIDGADATLATITIRGRGITITGFTITGGFDGVRIEDGGTATIEDNHIRDTGRNGITATRNGLVGILGNTIERTRQGIAVNQNSTAYIGFEGPFGDRVPQPNTIRDNLIGILVQRASQARIYANLIKDNSNDGIRVRRGAQARIAGNTIDSNAGNGIRVEENAVVNFGYENAPPLLDNELNTGSNNKYGLYCRYGACVTGSLGSLTGSDGDVDADETCVGNLDW